jgi:uncharacterized Zn-finger protein
MHSKYNIVVQCKLCDAKFKRTSLKRHVETIHEGKKYECHICNEDFTSKPSLKLHVSSIHEEKTFECTVCSASFTQRGNLKRHIVSIHEGERPFNR